MRIPARTLLQGVLSALLASTAAGLGSSCTAPLGPGASSPDEPFWMETIAHRGTSAFNPDPATYQVFRNVKDFGAVGDGVTDDTAAINYAMAFGGRCGDCGGTPTNVPAIVYFPQGTYLVSSPILGYYYTQIIGDAKVPPTLLAGANFTGSAVIDADPYTASGANWYTNQDNFYRSVRNFVIDLTQVPAAATATGIHWQVSQATSLMNLVFEMSTAPGTNHRGIYMEDGSGGFMGDMVFNGGAYGLNVGNQQFTVRNITVNNAQTAVYAAWDWGFTYQGVTIRNCSIGFQIATGSVGAEAIIDALVSDTPVFIEQAQASDGTLDGSLVLNNIALSNVPVAIGVAGGAVVLAGSTGATTIDTWVQGNVYTWSSGVPTYTQGAATPLSKPAVLLDAATGWVFEKTHPQYAAYSAAQFMSVKAQGAAGDGYTDDTAALQAVFDNYAGCYIIFFDAGTYLVSTTLTIPAGTMVVGEAWTTVMGNGTFFQDYNNPQVVVRVGAEGSVGVAEITDMIFTARGPAAGAIIVEWNVHEPLDQQGAAGTWDTHIIMGGRNGSNLQAYDCPTTANNTITPCFAAFMALHLTPQSSAYLEGLWVWLADHDLDWPGGGQLSLWSGRGIMSQSQGPVWLVGTGEHNIMYQYSLVQAENHYMGTMQTETPYFQPNPAPPAYFIPNSEYLDPTIGDGAAWALSVVQSENILLFGAGFYSFFQNYVETCEATYSCQSQIVNIDTESTISVYSLSTVDSTYQLSMDNMGVISQADNRNGFASTVTVWTPTG